MTNLIEKRPPFPKDGKQECQHPPERQRFPGGGNIRGFALNEPSSCEIAYAISQTMQALNWLESHTALAANADMEDFDSKAVAYVRGVVRELNTTPSDLAKLVGVSQTTITRPLGPESGYRITERTIRLIEKKTGIPFDAGRAASATLTSNGGLTEDLLLAALGPILGILGVHQENWPVVARALLRAIQAAQSPGRGSPVDRFAIAGDYAAQEVHRELFSATRK